ncbi:MAG: Sulfite exporter TauE/SafE [Candidatus Izimaplasma bacterium HR2]|nr:MAG: Sulfite exporter TauE/SafE [Candidatus Izimaplasma bacterium HR2]
MTLTIGIIVVLVVIFSAFLKGWSGFGTNLISIPILVLLNYEFKEAVIIVITLNLFLNTAILIENKKFNLRSLEHIKVLVIFGVIFNFVGIYFLKNFDPNILKIITGSLILLTAINKAISLKFKVVNKEKYYIPVGILSGIFNGIAGLGGLPVLLLLSNSDMKKDEFRTTLVSYFLVMNVMAIIGYVTHNLYTEVILINIGVILLFGLGAAMYGVYMSRRVSDSVFQRWFVFVMMFMGAGLTFNGLYEKTGTYIDMVLYIVVSLSVTLVIEGTLLLRTKLIKSSI